MIAVEGVSKRYGHVTAVERLSFSVQRGEVVGFLGPNGAGKTTAMRMITGTLQPDEGTVLLDGTSVSDDPMAAKRRIGYLPEANPLYDELIVSEYLDYVAELRGLSREETRSGVSDAVDETGIDEVFYRPIGECSKGYRQRIGMASAILHRPEVLILDEPTEGLDPNQRLEIRRLIGELGKERTVILSTHVLAEVQSTASRLLIIHGGKLVADGPVERLGAQASGRGHIVVDAVGDGILAALRGVEGVVDAVATKAAPGRTKVTVTGVGDDELQARIFRAAVDRGWTLYELRRETQSLEELFLDLTSDREVEA
jgi:ABC-2 type transport system ATP-binding protein